MNSPRYPLSAMLLCGLLLFIPNARTQAGSATWNLNPTSGDWNTAANWTPATVPNGPADAATFGVSNTTVISMVGAQVDGITFAPSASSFAITASPGFIVTISGAGLLNNSGIAQNFVTAGNGGGDYSVLEFSNGATAGLSTTFTNKGALTNGRSGGGVVFNETSTASSSIFNNDGSTVSGAGGGFTYFRDESTADDATIIANGGGGGGGGGTIQFLQTSTGAASRVKVFGNGSLDISLHDPPGVTIGSLEGSGEILLGANNLTVGSNGLSTTFSGVISGSGPLTKIGHGTQILTGANTYTGGTTISKGTLLVTNKTGSATGTGPVQVNAGTLGGTGKISGAVTVASGTKAATLAPGSGSKPGKLIMLSTLVFNSQAGYRVDLNNQTAKADSIVAKGVTINSGATFSIFDPGSGTLTTGTVFTVISNTAATPIAGTFRNAPDGSTINVGSDTFQVSYEGGDGNDMTLTVVP